MQKLHRLFLFVILAVFLVASPLVAKAQNYNPPQLERLVAPIALYPDSLLFHVLKAAYYPQQIAEADAWVDDPRFANTPHNIIEAELQNTPWDNSVKYLVGFPRVLHHLADNDDWAQSLGIAYAAQPYDVMDAVQDLRHDAREAGTLYSNRQVTVIEDGNNLLITPFDSHTIYVPAYDPTRVYGEWISVHYPPYVFAEHHRAPIVAPVIVEQPAPYFTITRTFYPQPDRDWQQREHEDHAFHTAYPAPEIRHEEVHHEEAHPEIPRHEEVRREEHREPEHKEVRPAPIVTPPLAPVAVSTPPQPHHDEAPKPLGLISPAPEKIMEHHDDHHDDHHDTPHDEHHP